MVRITHRRESEVVHEQRNVLRTDILGVRSLPHRNIARSANVSCVAIEQHFSVLERLQFNAARALIAIGAKVRAAFDRQTQERSVTFCEDDQQIALAGLAPEVVLKRKKCRHALNCGLLFTAAATAAVLFAVLVPMQDFRVLSLPGVF